MGILKVTVIEARNLVAKDLGGTSDPYCILRVGKEKKKTKVIKKNLAPRWNESFQFNVVNPYNETLMVEVKDYDLLSKDDPMGHVVIPLSNLIRGREQMVWFKLSNTRSGEIHLKLLAEDFGKDPVQVPPPGMYNQPYGYQPFMQAPYVPQPMMQPGMMQPGMMQPGMMQPGMMQPGMMQPGMQQPMMQQPQYGQPGYGTQQPYQQPQYGQPQQQYGGYGQQPYGNPQYPGRM